MKGLKLNELLDEIQNDIQSKNIRENDLNDIEVDSDLNEEEVVMKKVRKIKPRRCTGCSCSKSDEEIAESNGCLSTRSKLDEVQEGEVQEVQEGEVIFPKIIPIDIKYTEEEDKYNYNVMTLDEVTEYNKSNKSKKKVVEYKSNCGNCAYGDAFRCAVCPHRGMPAFKESDLFEFTADDLNDL